MNDPVTDLEIVCPFCPLHCDDVNLNSLADCEILKRHGAILEDGNRSGSIARIREQSVTLAEALAAARQQIRDSESVKLLVSSATMGQAKAMIETGFPIVDGGTATMNAVQSAMARSGVITATLAEAKQHADAIVLIGNVESSVPRLMEKLGTSAELFRVESPDAASIADLSMAIRHGQKFADKAYVAFLLGNESFNVNEAEVSVELLIELVVGMNAVKRKFNKRAVFISLDPLASLRSMSFLTNGKRLISAHQDAQKRSDSDTLMISVGGPSQPNAAIGIQIGGIDHGPEFANVFLPASQAGIHHMDAVIRGDGTVTLPLSKVRKSVMPTIAVWLGKL
jgi:hypothetical protein